MAAAVPALPSAAPGGAASGGRSTPPAASTSSTAAAAAAGDLTAHSSSSPVRGGHRMSIAALADVTEQVFGSPNALPGPPPSHFFPSISRQDRERLQQARLARDQQQPTPAPSATDYDRHFPGAHRRPEHEVAGAAVDATDEEQWRRERQAKLDLAAAGPFDNRRLPHHHPSASQYAETAFGAGSLEGTSEAEEAAIRTLQAGTAAGRVGAGGSGGTKRRFRDVDRTSWDAASELVRFERERDLADRNGAASDKSSTGTLQSLPFPTQDREKTPTPNTLPISAAAKGKGRAVEVGDFDQDDPGQGADFGGAHRRDSRMTDASMASEASEAEDDEDDASVMTGATRQSAGGNGSDGSGKEPAKKRSRTLTTPAQTAVLNALLAKTRFPSTETREEVGRQIGMSARRVQIWFQNRRQSQKRQREREAQEELATTRAARAMISAQAHHMIGYPVRVHTTYDPVQGGYVRAAQFYPPLQPKPAGPTEYVLINNNEPRPPHPFETYQMVSAQPIEYAAAGPQQVMVPISPGDPRYPPTYVTTTAAAAPGHYDEHGRLVQSSQGPVRVVPQQQRVASHQQSFPSKLYFPHVPRQAPAPQMSYRASGPPPPPLQPAFEATVRPQPDRNNSIASSAGGGGGGDVRLPSLSSVFAASNNNDSRDELPDPRAYRPAAGLPSAPPAQGEHAPMFSHSPFSPPPAAHATIPMQAAAAVRQPVAAPPLGVNPLQSRAVFSPEPASSFERLRISGEPVQAGGYLSAAGVDDRSLPWPAMDRPPTGGTARRPYSRDILDVAVEAMADQSSRALPPRHVLPPLRSVFSDNSFADDRKQSGAQSEADQALMAPIRPPTDPSSSSSSGGERSQRVNSVSSIAAGAPVSPSGISTLSNASRTTLSTAASFDFGRPPANSYRASREQDRYDLTGPALVHSNSGSTISPEKQNGAYVGGGSEYPQTAAAEEEEPEFWRNRGDSVGTGETSLSSADAHSIPTK